MTAFKFIAAEKANHSVELLCAILGVSRSEFYAWERRPPSDRALQDAWLTERIKHADAAGRGAYGARRVHAELAADGIRVGRKRVERLLRAAGLSGLVRRKHGRTTIRVPGVQTAADLVARDFRPTAPDKL